MANTKKCGKVVDRWDAVAIGKVTLTPANKKAVEEINASFKKGAAKKPATKKK